MTSNENYCIFAIDDNEQNLSVLGIILSHTNYNISLFMNGNEALEAVREFPPDLILVDIMMPEIDGFDFCKKIMENPKTNSIPLIFLTAKVDADDIEKGFDLGAVDYITKPFKKKELLARIRTHLKLKKTENELLKINEMKDRLFSIISHDLRGPLGTFKMLLDNIDLSKSLPNEEKVRSYLNHMREFTGSTYLLLDNLLNWARNQQKLVKMEPSFNNVKNIIDENLKLLNDSAQKKSIAIINEVNESLMAFFDANSISTVIRNLTSNAIKYTYPDGTIKISAERKNGFIQISIKDSGIGLEPDSLKKIFQSDIIFSKYGTNGEKGTGLGLVLCKDFVENNSGEIWVESKPGEGSVFKFTLPSNNN